MKSYFECPVCDFSCPYCTSKGHCSMYPDANPREECDDAMMAYEDGVFYEIYENEDLGFDPYLGCYTDDC